MNKDNVVPSKITVWGKELTAVGRGKFPYDCIDRDRFPNAMVYQCDGGWTHEFSEAFNVREKSKDVYESKQLKYIVQPGDIGHFQIFNTRDKALLGGVSHRSLEEAFQACDQWNGVPPGASARAQQITVVPSGIHPATRLMSVTADLHELGHGIYEAIQLGDRDLLEHRQKQYSELATEYIGLAAANIVAKQELASRLGQAKTAVVSGEDFTLTISAVDGRVLAASCKTAEAAERVAQIDHFDIQEAAEWVERTVEANTIEGHSFALPAIGFWKKDGSYQSAEEDYRAEIEADLGLVTGARP